MYTTPANIPLFYGLIKLHKEGYPIRPITSLCGSPTYEVSKHLTKILNPTTDLAPQKLKNSQSLKESMQNLTILDNCMLVSYDVKQLFTSIPQQLAIDCLESLLIERTDWKERTDMEITDILDLTKLCINSAIF